MKLMTIVTFNCMDELRIKIGEGVRKAGTIY